MFFVFCHHSFDRLIELLFYGYCSINWFISWVWKLGAFSLFWLTCSMMIAKFSFLGGGSLNIHTIHFQICLIDCIVNWFGLYLYRLKKKKWKPYSPPLSLSQLMQSNYYLLLSPLVHNHLGADVPLIAIDRAIYCLGSFEPTALPSTLSYMGRRFGLS